MHIKYPHQSLQCNIEVLFADNVYSFSDAIYMWRPYQIEVIRLITYFIHLVLHISAIHHAVKQCLYYKLKSLVGKRNNNM